MNLKNIFKNKILVATHDGRFHADEIFAIATLLLWAEKKNFTLNIIRTREEAKIDEADIVVDVGGIYDPEKKRFDHHQKEGAGNHYNNVPYASFGLIWKHYSTEICNKGVSNDIKKRLVIPIDARDNGMNITKTLREDVTEYTLSKDIILAFRPTWKHPEENDAKFLEAINFARMLLEKEIKNSSETMEGENIVMTEIEKQNKPQILVLQKNLPWDYVVSKFFEIKAVVYPEREQGSWCAEFAKDNPKDFTTNRGEFITEWRGLRDENLQKASGIKDAIFCHREGFFAVTKTKESAIDMINTSLKK